MVQKSRYGAARRRQGGFTLVEAVYAIMIIGLGVASMMQVFATGTRVNSYGDYLSKAVFLAEEMRSMTDDVAFDNLPGYDGQTFSGVDANGNAVPGLTDFIQQVDATTVDPVSLLPYVGPNPEAIVLTARVSYSGDEVARLSWLRTR